MVEKALIDSALVLVGHGSTLNGESADPVYRHADTFRELGVFNEVQECFWKLEPGVSRVLQQVFSPRVFIVPLFISEGYFTQQVIPRELGFCDSTARCFQRVKEAGNQRLYYCDPVGTHLSMTGALAHRASEVLDQDPFPKRPNDAEVSLFIAGHGTGNNVTSRQIIESQAETLRKTGQYADVHAVFMEEEPRIEACYQLAKTRNIVMVPFFISDGLHSYEDIPVMLGESESTVAKRMREGLATWRNPTERHGKLVWYTRSIGLDPRIPDVIMERVREAAEWTGSEMLTTAARS